MKPSKGEEPVAVPRGEVLIIDDEELIRESVRMTLERAGYSVCVAGTRQQALQHCNSRSVDLVICDLLMPEESGTDMIRAIRNWSATVKIIAISGGDRFDPGAPLSQAIEAGADMILPKPFGAREIIKAVAEMLQR